MQAELERRLRALKADDEIWDWLEVVRRAQRERAARLRRRLLVAAAALVLLAVPALAIATGNADILSLSLTEDDVPPAEGAETGPGYAFGDRLYLRNRPPARLAAPVFAPFLGKRAALLIPSPDGRKIVYHAWKPADGPPEGGTSLLRVFDAETGRDTVLERGAHAAAWRADGTLAYVRALVPEYRSSSGTTGGRIGHVVVRPALDDPAVRWTALPTEWVVRAWAGSRLLVSARASNVFRGRQPESGVYAFSGPRRSRRLPLNGITAVSPDGRLAVGPAGALDDFHEASRVRAVDVASGRVVAELDLRSVRQPAIEAGLESGVRSGSWAGSSIVLETGIGEASGILVLRFRDGKLSVEQVLRLKSGVGEQAGLPDAILINFGQPVFVDRAGRDFTAELTFMELPERPASVFLTCNRLERRCRRGRSLEPITRWAALVHNPSRPLR